IGRGARGPFELLARTVVELADDPERAALRRDPRRRADAERPPAVGRGDGNRVGIRPRRAGTLGAEQLAGREPAIPATHAHFDAGPRDARSERAEAPVEAGIRR